MAFVVLQGARNQVRRGSLDVIGRTNKVVGTITRVKWTTKASFVHSVAQIGRGQHILSGTIVLAV
jgi:hypothetical protein